MSLAAVIVFAAAVLANAQGSSNIVGSWDMTTKSPQGDRPGLLVITKQGDKLAAAMKGARGELPLNSITLNGNDVKMVMTIQFQGSDMVITYTGKVENEMMKGEADFGGLATGEWFAVPHKEGAGAGSGTGTGAGTGSGGGTGAGTGSGNISGVWNATVETSQGSGNPEFTFKQEGEKITGTYKGTFGEAPLTGTLKGSDISFSIKVNFQGQEFDVTYTGKVEGNNMKGTAKLGELGEATWTAKKQ
jgi:hypothetical protein